MGCNSTKRMYSLIKDLKKIGSIESVTAEDFAKIQLKIDGKNEPALDLDKYPINGLHKSITIKSSGLDKNKRYVLAGSKAKSGTTANSVIKTAIKAIENIREGKKLTPVQNSAYELLKDNLNATTVKKDSSIYVGGFSNKGKGTPEGDGKDKAMREVADGFIGELYGTFKAKGEGFRGGYGTEQYNSDSSTATSYGIFEDQNDNIVWDAGDSEAVVTAAATSGSNKIIMLARNKETGQWPLSKETKTEIDKAHNLGATFVVGDMPGVDSQFIDYLNEIGASYNIYHAGNKPRITAPSSIEPTEHKKEDDFAWIEELVSLGVVPKTSSFKYRQKLARELRDIGATKEQASTITKAYGGLPEFLPRAIRALVDDKIGFEKNIVDIDAILSSMTNHSNKDIYDKKLKDLIIRIEESLRFLPNPQKGETAQDTSKTIVPVNGGEVAIVGNALTQQQAEFAIKQMEKDLLDPNIDKVTNVGDVNRQVAIAYGPIEYTYSLGRGKKGTHKAKEIPKWLVKLARKIEVDLGKPEGYYNHVLFNKFARGEGIGGHTDNESIYQDSKKNVGSVAIISIGGTKTDHIIGGQKFKASNNSLVEMSTGDLHHTVAKADDKGRYSITFRHIPKENLPVTEGYLDRTDWMDIPEKVREELKEISSWEDKIQEYLNRGNTINSLAELKNFIKSFSGVPIGSDQPTTPVKGKYELFPGVYANKGQEEAIDTLSDFLTNSKETEYVLKGRGGTGKTTIVNKVLELAKLMPKEVFFTTESHKATQVIKLANKNSKYANSTYAVFASSLFKRQTRKGIVSKLLTADPSVIVVDEASMASGSRIQELREQAKEIGAKIIYMGDNVQLPPVERHSAGSPSPVFNKSKHPNLVELNQRMRQGEESPILPITDVLANFVEDGSPIVFDGKSTNKGGGEVLYQKSGAETTRQFVEDFKRNPKGTRYVWYNNATHKNTVQLVKDIRAALYGDKAKSKFVEGEQIILNDNYKVSREDGYVGFNSAEYTIENQFFTDSHTIGYTTFDEDGIPYQQDYTYKGRTRHLTVSNNIDGSIATLSTPANGIGELGNVSKQIRTEFADIGYAYVISSHKAQGSTYETVYTDVENILNPRFKSNPIDQAKSLYVATSRPTKKLVMLNADRFIRGNSPAVETRNNNVGTLKKLDNGMVVFSDNSAKKSFSNIEDIVAFVKDYASITGGSINNKDIDNLRELYKYKPKEFKIDISKKVNQTEPAYHSSDRNGNSTVFFGLNESHDVANVMVHEYTHVLTSHLINNNKKYRAKIRNLMNLSQKRMPSLSGYAFKDEHEFLAEIMNQPELRKTLSEIEIGGKNNTVWDKIVEVFKGILSDVKNAKVKTILSESLSLIYDPNYEPVNDVESKGSSQNTSFVDRDLGDELWYQDTLDGNNIKDNFMRLASEDIADGNNIYATEAFNDHLVNTIGMIEEFYREYRPDYNIELEVNTTDRDTETKGSYSKKINFRTGKQEDKISILRDRTDKTASSSEIMLHETLHSFFSNAFKNQPKLALKMKALRKEIINLGGDYTLFLQQSQFNKSDITDREIQSAKDKFDYALSDSADIEEFAAYAMSNSFLFNAIKDVELSSEVSKSRNGSIFEKLYSLFIDVVNSMRGVPAGSKGSDLIMSTMKDIYAFNVKVESKIDYDNYADMYSSINFIKNKPPLMHTMYTVGSIVDMMNKGGLKAEPYLVKSISKLLEVKDNIVENGKKSRAGDFIKGLMKFKSISSIVNSRLVQNVWNQHVDDTANGINSDIYSAFRHTKSIIDTTIIGAKKEMTASIEKMSLHHAENSILAKSAIDNIFKIGMSKYVFDLDPEVDLETERLNELVEEARKSLVENSYISDAMVYELDSLSRFAINRESTGPNQKTNIHNILSNLGTVTYSESLRDKAERYVALKSFSMVSEENLDSVYVMLTDEVMSKELKEISSMYGEFTRKAMPTSGTIDHSIFGYMEHDPSDRQYTLDLVSEDEINLDKNHRLTIVDDEPTMIAGEKFYMVKFRNIDVPFEDGLLGSIGIRVDGISIRKKINKLYSSVIVSDEKLSEEYKTLDAFVSSVLDGISDKNAPKGFSSSKRTIVPEYDEHGNIKDFIIPFTKDDISGSMEVKDDISSYMSHTLSRLINVKASRINNKKSLNLLLDFYEDNKYNDDVSFIKISKKTTPTIWSKLSVEVKKEVLNNNNGQLNIPSDLLELIVGSKQASLSNLEFAGFGVKTEKTKHIIMVAEKLVSEIIGKNKAVTVMYNSAVFLNNMISNMTVAWIHGINPIEYYKNFTRDWSLLTDYEEMNRKLYSVEIEEMMGRDKRKESSILRKQLDDSKFKGLIEDGQFTPLIDDMNSDPEGLIGNFLDENLFKKDLDSDNVKREMMLEANNRYSSDRSISLSDHYSDVVHEYKSKNTSYKLPAKARTVTNILYGPKGTFAHKFATKLVMYGDTLTKQMIADKKKNEIRTKERREVTKVESDAIFRDMDQMFVNYSYNTSGQQMWAEKVAGVLFIKYLFRIGKAMALLIRKKPVPIIGQQGLQYSTYDIADPLDAVTNNSPVENIANRWVLDDPGDQLVELLAPNIHEPFGVSFGDFIK